MDKDLVFAVFLLTHNFTKMKKKNNLQGQEFSEF